MKDHISLTDELIAKYNRPGPRYTSYPTAVEFHAGVGDSDYRKALERANSKPDAPWSLYFHLPFCEERCLFCACNVVITKKRSVARDYLHFLKSEIEMAVRYFPQRRTVSQLHLGGGTPTYYTPSELETLMDIVEEHFSLTDGAELAVEVDPTVTSKEHIKTLARRGFNRFSLGVQDFDPTVQRAVNRIQSFRQTEECVKTCREAGAHSINIDLICGLPYQTVENFQKTLELVLQLAPDRLAVYSFAYVPWLKGHQKKLPQEAMPDAKLRTQLQWAVREFFLSAGYVEIGMDHYAKPEDPLARAHREGRLRRNFMGYTVIPAPDWLGFGASAIGYVSDAFFQNTKKLSRYREAIEAGEFPVERGIILSRDDLIRQDVIEQIMCNLQLDFSKVEERWGLDFGSYFSEELNRLEELAREGVIEMTSQGFRATPLGKILVRDIASCFDAYLKKKSQKPAFSKII